jgi:hypothetical protein
MTLGVDDGEYKKSQKLTSRRTLGALRKMLSMSRTSRKTTNTLG